MLYAMEELQMNDECDLHNVNGIRFPKIPFESVDPNELLRQ